jgi:hypothetical protein
MVGEPRLLVLIKMGLPIWVPKEVGENYSQIK